MRSVFVLALLLAAAVPAQVGRIDTVGATTYDWQLGGPAYRFISCAAGFGVPVTWIRSLSDQTTFPDRNQGYNYYDFAAREWVFNDTDWTRSGMDVFVERCGCGTIDADPGTGQAYVSSHSGWPLRPSVGREVQPGSGMFEFSAGPEGFCWPVTVLDSAGALHAVLIDDGTHDRLHWTRMRSWGTWDSVQAMAAGMPEPGFPSHNIGAARTNGHVALAWAATDDPLPYWAFLRESRDGGASWDSAFPLAPPDSFGPDTLASFHLGVFPYCDRQGRLHVVAEVQPVVEGQSRMVPVDIWHWSPDNVPEWSRIARCGCDPANIRCPVGYNALYAGRPSIAEDRLGGLHVVWEQFDSINFEPGPPEYLRADIWYCRDNSDNGATWREPVRLTVPDSSSKRFPSVPDFIPDDTLRVLYLVDLVAGFAVQGEGDPTVNPVVCQSVPLDLSGVEDKAEGGRLKAEPGWPTILRGPGLLPPDCRVLDISGRDVTDRRDRLAPGVYFLHSSPGIRHSSLVTKVVVQR